MHSYLHISIFISFAGKLRDFILWIGQGPKQISRCDSAFPAAPLPYFLSDKQISIENGGDLMTNKKRDDQGISIIAFSTFFLLAAHHSYIPTFFIMSLRPGSTRMCFVSCDRKRPQLQKGGKKKES